MNLSATVTDLLERVFGTAPVPVEVQTDEYGETVTISLPAMNLIFRFVRDRGEDFLDVAAIHRPSEYYQSDDLEIAFGWRTIDDALHKQAPEPLHDILVRLRDRMDELAKAFSQANFDETLNRLKDAQARRAEERAVRLR